MPAIIKAPIIFLFQSLVKQISLKKDHFIHTRYKCEEE